MLPRPLGLAAIGFLCVRLSAAQAPAESFGPGEQALHVGVASFRTVLPGASYIEASDGFYYVQTGTLVEWVAPVTLPEGAVVTEMCLYGYDISATAPAFVSLSAAKLNAVSPYVEHDVVNPVFTQLNQGYEVACSGPISYTYREVQDFNGDGVADSVPHRLLVHLDGATGGLGFGGVRLRYRRQVSPAPSAATFGDVPSNHPYFQFIEALGDSGITAGCQASPPLYCPDRPITRGEMAVYLAKALGLQWP